MILVAAVGAMHRAYAAAKWPIIGVRMQFGCCSEAPLQLPANRLADHSFICHRLQKIQDRSVYYSQKVSSALPHVLLHHAGLLPFDTSFWPVSGYSN
jgi:hypothetical protein